MGETILNVGVLVRVAELQDHTKACTCGGKACAATEDGAGQEEKFY